MKRRLLHTDENLLLLLRQSNAQAFEEIYNRYWSKLYSQAYKRLKFRDSTEEVIQELFADLWERRADLQITSSLEAYLRTAVKYLVINYFQREEVRHRYLAYYEQNKNSETSCTEEELAFNELENVLQQHVAYLPPQSKKVYELSRQHHLTIPEIAQQLNISEKTAENHLGRALRALRSSLREYVSVFVLFIFS